MPGPRSYLTLADLPGTIPVFPLAGVLVLPRADLPLNVFEPRYLAMVDAAMAGERVIGMIQPKGGDERDPKPELCAVGCVGRITKYAETDDGRYLITVSGIARFRVAREIEAGTPYRQIAADYTAYLRDLSSEDDGLEQHRDRLIAALRPYLGERKRKTDWDAIADAPEENLVNALSMICPFEPPEKQALLEARDLKERADALIALLELSNAASGAPSAAGSSRQVN